MTCEIVQEVCKLPDERKVFPAFDLTAEFARLWLASYPFSSGVRIRPWTDKRKTGLEYESSGGVTGPKEPRSWPTTIGDTLADGSITWTARAMSYDSLMYRIFAVDYTTPSGITLHEQSFIDQPGAQIVPMEVSGGAEGEVYDIVARVTSSTVGSSTQIRDLILRVTID